MMQFETGVRSQIKSFLREPLNIVLVIVIPLLVVEGFGQAMASLPETGTMQAVPSDMGRIMGATFATAFLAGILGLFQAINAREADERLVLTGFSSMTLLVTRLATIVCVGSLVAGISYGVLLLDLTPERPALAFVFLLVGAIVYALVGVLVGALLPREFEGSLIMVFVANMDAFLGSGMSKVKTPLPEYFPLYYPRQLFQSAVIDGAYSTNNLVATTMYITVLFLVVSVIFSRATRSDGVIV